MNLEKQRLNEIAEEDPYGSRVNSAMMRYSAELALRSVSSGGSLLELGPAGGVGTAILAERFDRTTVVDAAESALASVRRCVPHAETHLELFEDFAPDTGYDLIVMGHVLEHVVDPVGVLRKYRSHLNPGGSIYIAVPNADSIHRSLGVALGLLSARDELNSSDLKIGHRRVYSRARLQNDIEESGLRVCKSGGFFFKCFSNAQTEQVADDKTLSALMEVGERFPDVAAEIYAVATN